MRDSRAEVLTGAFCGVLPVLFRFGHGDKLFVDVALTVVLRERDLLLDEKTEGEKYVFVLSVASLFLTSE